MKAITLSYDSGGWETGNPEGEGEAPAEDTGDFMETLASLFGGGGSSNGSPGGGSLGESLGTLAGAGLGSLVGPAGTAIGAGLGKAVGGGVERLVKVQTTRAGPASQGPKRRLSQNERRILANGQEMTKRTGNPAYAEEASLRVYRPAEYRRRRAAGTLPTQGLPPPSSRTPAQLPPPSRPRIAFPMMAPQLEQERRAEPPIFDAFEEDEYNETAAPDPRPRPIRHTSVTPLPREYMEVLVRDVPAVKSLDPRLLRLASGTVSVARDVSGVDPSTGTYHALPGETPHGITKKLTGQVERVAELLAANPGKQESSPVWNIPPGWLVYDRETGALATARKYSVQQGDSPFSIAKKLGASARPKWFSELRTANPQKPVKNGNFVSLHAGEELGVPDDWPENPLAVPVSGAAPPSQSAPASQSPSSSSTPQLPAPAPSPGLPGPGQNSTMDPGAILQVQLMLGRWGRRNPAAINPSDFGNTYDFTSTMTPRTVQAIQSFQLWWNRERPLRPLRMDGVLDNDTMAAIKEAEQVASSYPGIPGMQVPSPPQPGQATQQYPFPQSPPPGWPTNLPWPPFPIPGQTTPQQQPAPQQQPIPQQPVPQQQQPAPQQQQPAPQQQQQPIPQQQPSQTAPFPFPQSPPPGWPSNVPWPPFPIPGQTAPQQQPVPQQQQQQQPAPQQQQPTPQQQPQWPYGWPWGWPWGYQPQQPAPQQQQQQPAPQQQQQQPAPQQQAPAPLPFPFPNLPPWLAMPNIPNISKSSAPAPAPAPTPTPTGQTAPSSALPPFDAHMPEDQRQILRYILQNETRVDALIMAANMYDATGYPMAGHACRARAVALAAILDSHMPEDLRQIVRSILQNETRADSLDWAANVYDAMGYPMAAQALRSRSQSLKAGPAPAPYPAPVPAPVPWFPPPSPEDIEEQPPIWTYPENPAGGHTQTAGNESSLMPMLALVGAGLAFT